MLLKHYTNTPPKFLVLLLHRSTSIKQLTYSQLTAYTWAFFSCTRLNVCLSALMKKKWISELWTFGNQSQRVKKSGAWIWRNTKSGGVANLHIFFWVLFWNECSAWKDQKEMVKCLPLAWRYSIQWNKGGIISIKMLFINNGQSSSIYHFRKFSTAEYFMNKR